MTPRKSDPAAAARRHLKAAETLAGHLDGHMLVMHHLEVGFVAALLGNAKDAQAAVDRADEHAGSDAYRDALSDPGFVREYELAKAKIFATLGKAEGAPR